MMDKENEIVKQEIRREFQLERMVLFSDAVFAIVITLMAIEIHLPHTEEKLTYDILIQQLRHLIPTVIAYIISFLFIGFTWYRHLNMFGMLKNYDGGLVVRNLMLLFCISLFPFSASLTTHVGNVFLPIAIYLIVVLACSASQLWLQHYILIKRPQLRIHGHMVEEVRSFKISRAVFIILVLIFILVTVTFYTVPGNLKYIAWWWFIILPFLLKWYKKRIK